MPDYKGRIFGRSVLDALPGLLRRGPVPGRAAGRDDPERGRRYLFRVTDVAYGSESSDAGWAERTAGGLMAMDQVGEATTLRDFEKRLYKVAEVVPLGYVDAKGFHKPKSLPAQFAAVSAPTDADLAFLRERMGDVEVGGCARARTPSTCRSGSAARPCPATSACSPPPAWARAT